MNYFDIKTVLIHIISEKSDDGYVFVDGHPVNTKSEKYIKFLRFFQSDQLKCKCCKTPATKFKLKKCTTSGALHEKSGKIKYTFILLNEDNIPMTFDHWIPKSFLKKKKLKGKGKNIVLMCEKCNESKGEMVLLNWQLQYNKM